MAITAEVERQQIHDRNWENYQEVLQARLVAAAASQRAIASGEIGAVPAFRQSLVDLIAVCELLTDDLPAPTV